MSCDDTSRMAPCGQNTLQLRGVHTGDVRVGIYRPRTRLHPFVHSDMCECVNSAINRANGKRAARR